MLITRASLPNKVSCSVSTCVSSDNSLLSVRQEPTLGPWKDLPSCNKKTGPEILHRDFLLSRIIPENWKLMEVKNSTFKVRKKDYIHRKENDSELEYYTHIGSMSIMIINS